MVFFLFANAGAVATDDLLTYVEGAVPARGWNTLGELNMINWQANAKNEDARRVGEALATLFARSELLSPAQRARLLAVIDGKEARETFPRFLRGFIPEIRRLKRREISYRHTMTTAKMVGAAGAVRISVYCPAEDADRVRDFAASLMKERGIAIPERPRGRPPKASSDILEPTEADIAAASLPLSAPSPTRTKDAATAGSGSATISPGRKSRGDE